MNTHPAGDLTLTMLMLNSGRQHHLFRSDVTPNVLALLREWCAAHLNSGKYHPLTVSSLSDYVCRLSSEGNGLLATLATARMPRREDPPGTSLLVSLSSLGVATDAAGDALIRPRLLEQHRSFGHAAMPPAPNLIAPWALVTDSQWLDELPATKDWIPDFQRCLAWAWITLVTP